MITGWEDLHRNDCINDNFCDLSTKQLHLYDLNLIPYKPIEFVFMTGFYDLSTTQLHLYYLNLISYKPIDYIL